MSNSDVRTRFSVPLPGCRPEPLSSYLKALAVLRLVAEQKDPEARGAWQGEQFVLTSSLDREALVQFFAAEWRPTPVVAPWNGGSGFYPKDNQDAPTAIVSSSDPRLSTFAETIKSARGYVAARGWAERPSDENKVVAISAMRALLPDEAVAWVDAAVVLGTDFDGHDRLMFPPLLGTGGNDGRLDFSNNYQQRVVEVLAAESTAPLESSLLGGPVTSRFKGTMGQYQPASSERTNPWDFVLLIEGALLFAGAATRRWESAGGMTTVTESDEGESRNELWLPLWSRAATLREIRQLFAEGRATVGHGDRARPAASALDFARAVSALGVDRGIDGFSRIGFHVRNGLAYFATPLGRFATKEVPAARLLDDVDGWYERFRQRASGKTAPAGVALVRRQLELAMFEAAQTGALKPVLLALGEAELALSQSLSFTTKAFLRPVPRLQAAWCAEVVDGTVEQRLAAALASRPGIRSRLLPLEKGTGTFGRADDAEYVFRRRPLVENLLALLRREDIESQQRDIETREPLVARCSLADIASFIARTTDDVLIERWLRAFVLIDGLDLGRVAQDGPLPPATYAVIALVHNRRLGEEKLPRTTGVLARAIAGDAVGATEVAIRRLCASGRPLPMARLLEAPATTRRIAAALAFPLSTSQRRKLESMVLPAVENSSQTSEQLSKESV
jgi:CRISPR-associated protein Csx17